MARNVRYVSPDDVRRWAQEHGIEVAGRGRFSTDVVSAFNGDAAHRRRSIQYVPGQEPTVALYDDAPAPAAPPAKASKPQPQPKSSSGKAATKEVAAARKNTPAKTTEPVKATAESPAPVAQAPDSNGGGNPAIMPLAEVIETLQAMEKAGNKNGKPVLVTVQSIMYA